MPGRKGVEAGSVKRRAPHAPSTPAEFVLQHVTAPTGCLIIARSASWYPLTVAGLAALDALTIQPKSLNLTTIATAAVIPLLIVVSNPPNAPSSRGKLRRLWCTDPIQLAKAIVFQFNQLTFRPLLTRVLRFFRFKTSPPTSDAES